MKSANAKKKLEKYGWVVSQNGDLMTGAKAGKTLTAIVNPISDQIIPTGWTFDSDMVCSPTHGVKLSWGVNY